MSEFCDFLFFPEFAKIFDGPLELEQLEISFLTFFFWFFSKLRLKKRKQKIFCWGKLSTSLWITFVCQNAKNWNPSESHVQFFFASSSYAFSLLKIFHLFFSIILHVEIDMDQRNEFSLEQLCRILTTAKSLKNLSIRSCWVFWHFILKLISMFFLQSDFIFHHSTDDLRKIKNALQLNYNLTHVGDGTKRLFFFNSFHFQILIPIIHMQLANQENIFKKTTKRSIMKFIWCKSWNWEIINLKNQKKAFKIHL